ARRIEIATGYSDLRFRTKDARPRHDAAIHGIAQVVERARGVAEIAYGRESVHQQSVETGQHVEHALRRPPHEGLGDLGTRLAIQIQHAGEMHVHVDEARHHPGIFEVDHRVTR